MQHEMQGSVLAAHMVLATYRHRSTIW